jgi:pimeloyl-ACP methyl ester carboxylesterase
MTGQRGDESPRRAPSPGPGSTASRGASGRVDSWRRRGRRVEFRGYSVHVFERDGRRPILLYLHGFPTSSYDWRRLLDLEAAHAVLAPDCLGFGLSDKPREFDYTIDWQTDLVEHLLARRDGDVFIVAHDMGTAIAGELMARDLEGRLSGNVVGGLLLNSSIIVERARRTLSERLLPSPVGPLLTRMVGERFFRRQFGSLFSEAHQLEPAEAQDQWQLIAREDGHRLAHRLIHYMQERVERAGRWQGAIAKWPKPLAAAWGMSDRVSTPAVLEGLKQLRPNLATAELHGVGHYPHIEAPAAVRDVLERTVDR